MKTIKFQKGEPPLVFFDAIALSDEEAAVLGEQDIEAIKEERYQQWLAIMTSSSEAPDGQEQIVEEGLTDG